MSPEQNVPGSPVSLHEVTAKPSTLRPQTALALSGGGYRAMLFHLGALWRLNQAGLLQTVDRVSSVSGGSITAGVLALQWPQLGFVDGVAARFEDRVVKPIRSFAGKTIDESSVLGGLLTPGSTVGDKVAAAYQRFLFDDATLQDLPDRPRFVFNATNVQSGALWRFSKPYMRDYRVGEVVAPNIPLATAVAASSAFPPVLSPVHLELDPNAFTKGSGLDLQREPFTSDVILSDGGVYDNLGLETVYKEFKTILVSDGGAKIEAEQEPKHDWVRHSIRILDLIDNQVRSLRKRQLIDAYQKGERAGAYWGIRTQIGDYQLVENG